MGNISIACGSQVTRLIAENYMVSILRNRALSFFRLSLALIKELLDSFFGFLLTHVG
jgi:hypothetical protein